MDIIITKNTKRLIFEYDQPNGYGQTHFLPPYLRIAITERGVEYLKRTGAGPDVEKNKVLPLCPKGLARMKMEQDPRERFIFDNGATIKIDL